MMLGGRFVEMALWKIVGDLLDERGWTTALREGGIASAGLFPTCIPLDQD